MATITKKSRKNINIRAMKSLKDGELNRRSTICIRENWAVNEVGGRWIDTQVNFIQLIVARFIHIASDSRGELNSFFYGTLNLIQTVVSSIWVYSYKNNTHNPMIQNFNFSLISMMGLILNMILDYLRLEELGGYWLGF